MRRIRGDGTARKKKGRVLEEGKKNYTTQQEPYPEALKKRPSLERTTHATIRHDSPRAPASAICRKARVTEDQRGKIGKKISRPSRASLKTLRGCRGNHGAGRATERRCGDGGNEESCSETLESNQRGKYPRRLSFGEVREPLLALRDVEVERRREE